MTTSRIENSAQGLSECLKVKHFVLDMDFKTTDVYITGQQRHNALVDCL